MHGGKRLREGEEGGWKEEGRQGVGEWKRVWREGKEWRVWVGDPTCW